MALGEALAVVLHFVSSDWSVEQRLVRVQMLSKSLTSEEIARELINVLSVTYSIHSNNLLAAMRDRASTNNVAMNTLKIVYPSIVDVGCFFFPLENNRTVVYRTMWKHHLCFSLTSNNSI